MVNPMKTIRAFLLTGSSMVLVPLLASAVEQASQSAGKLAPATKPPPAATASAKPAAKPATGYPVIGHLEQRNRTITLKAGPQGTLYVVKSKDGKLLADEATLEELKAQLPEVHEFLRTATGKARPGKPSANDAALRLDSRVR